MKYQRAITGIIATIFLIAGGLMFFSDAESFEATAGICIRVGLMLGAVWLAWPEFEWLRKKSSPYIIPCIVGLLLIIAVRRQLFPIAATLLVGGLAVNGILRRLTPGR